MMNYHFFKLKNMALLAISLMVVGCNKDIVDVPPSTTENEQKNLVQNGTELILGKQLENPYALKNMQQAMDTLIKSMQKSSLSGKPYGKNTLQATHYYVVFVPENKEHLAILADIVTSRKFVTRSFPMDYEVIQHGTNYVDKHAKSAELPVLYASIPVTETMPKVPYKKLEDLYLTDDKNDPDDLLEFSALYLAKALPVEHNFTGKPADNVYNTTLYDHLNENKQAFFAIFNRSYHPQGTVRVQNSDGSYQPLQNAEIEIYNWFFNAYCHTDTNGNFRSPDWFRREMGVYLTWNSQSATISTEYNEILGVRRSDKIGDISRGSNGKTFDIQNTDRHKWRKATVHNALQVFNRMIKLDKLPTITDKINVWVLHSEQHNGMAPMMKRHNLKILYPSLAAIARTRPQALLPGVAAIAVGKMVENSYPDVIINVGRYNTEDIYQLVFHELAHVIHSIQVGGNYWGKFAHVTLTNILSLPDNDPYGNGIQPTPEEGQLIALCEGWANFLEHKIMRDTHYIDRGYYLENFTMYTIPTNVPNKRIGHTDKYQGWFLHGLMWGLADIKDYEDYLEYPDDYYEEPIPETILLVDGQDMKPIHTSKSIDAVFIRTQDLFNALKGDVKTGFQLKQSLKKYNSHKNQEIEGLFNAYGY
ncbi:hypothetical protein [Capnocytophaga cynodegmi]|uniref:hypothetical protein n=1 Tax=Capnocytophaga cynodegmi TaxID=28189 RepID=UPI00385F78AF